MRAPEHDPEPASVAESAPADELAAWRAQKAAERMALLRLLQEEAQEQADLFQACRRDLWDVKIDHEAYLNRLRDLTARRLEGGGLAAQGAS